MSLGGSELLGGCVELGSVVGTLPDEELFSGEQGFTAVAGRVADGALGFEEGRLPAPLPLVAGVPVPTLVDELPPGLVDEELVAEPALPDADEGAALPVAVPLLVTVAVVLSHGTATVPALPETFPALPVTVGVPWVARGLPVAG